VQTRLGEPGHDLHRAEIHSRPESCVPIPRQSEELHDDVHGPEIYAHFGQCFDPLPSQIPVKKRKGFKHFKSKLREFFGLRR